MIEATVIIAAWSAEDTLDRALKSVLADQGVSIEVIVVDDASPDDTLAVARRIAADNPDVTVLSQSVNRGPAAARNAAVAQARGEWIAVLDADDAFRPGRLRRLIDLAEEKGADIVADALMLVDDAGRTTTAPPLSYAGDPEAAAWTVEDYIDGNRIRAGRLGLGYLKPVIRRAFLNRRQIEYDETLRNGEDFHFVLSALMAGARMWHLGAALYLYSIRSGSISNRLRASHARALDLADAAFLRVHGDSLSPEARRSMLLRMRENADLAVTEVAMQDLKSGRLFAAVRTLISRPRALGRFAAQLGEAGRKRLGVR